MTIYTNTNTNTSTYACRTQRHNEDERLRLLEKYTSHFIWKGCMWEGVGDRTELQHIGPHSYGHQRFFPVLLGCSTEGLGPSLSECWFSLQHHFSNTLISKLNRGSRGPFLPGAVFSTASFSNSSDPQNSQSEAWGLPLLGAGFLYRILSPTGLVSKLHLVIL